MKLNLLYLFACLILITSCKKKEFDEPPANGQDPSLTVNLSIDSLKIKYYNSGQCDTIKDDVIIAGTVIADDKSGNFYKTVVIQDSTAGISIRIDQLGRSVQSWRLPPTLIRAYPLYQKYPLVYDGN